VERRDPEVVQGTYRPGVTLVSIHVVIDFLHALLIMLQQHADIHA